jgi:triosephosphate isomerase
LIVSNLFGRIELGNVISVLYGGSVKPENIEEQLALENIDGSLVGGASLKADDFNKLIAAGQKRLKLTSVK